MSLAEAAKIAKRHGFVLRAVTHEGQVRIAMIRPERTEGAAPDAPRDDDDRRE